MLDAHAYLTSTGWRLICWSPSLSAVLFSSCSSSQYRGTVTSSSRASPGRKPSELQSYFPAIPPCGSYAEVARILLTLISLICAWKGKTWRHNTDLTVYSPKRVRQAWRHTSVKRLRVLPGDRYVGKAIPGKFSLYFKKVHWRWIGRIRGTYNMKCKYE